MRYPVGHRAGQLEVIEVRERDYVCVCSCGAKCFRAHSSLSPHSLEFSEPKCRACLKAARRKRNDNRELAAKAKLKAEGKPW